MYEAYIHRMFTMNNIYVYTNNITLYYTILLTSSMVILKRHIFRPLLRPL